jgi:hypothetical protein
MGWSKKQGIRGIIGIGEVDMSKLICPNCGVATSFSPEQIIGRGILLDYSTEAKTTWGKVQISAVTSYTHDEDTYAILVCRACNEYFVAKREKYTEEDNWSPVYPIPHKPAAKEIPEPVKGEFEEANLCFAVGAYRGCVSMCETALEALWRKQDASGLQDLKEKGIISPQLYDRGKEVRLWGNVAKHEPIPDAVEKEDAEQLLTYLETILNAVYVEPERLAKLAQKREQLKKK